MMTDHCQVESQRGSHCATPFVWDGPFIHRISEEVLFVLTYIDSCVKIAEAQKGVKQTREGGSIMEPPQD
jgi:hypothetical protein